MNLESPGGKWREDDDQNVRIYSSLFSQHGDSHRSLDWGSRESQEKRFGILAGIGDLQGCGILDVGCGLGDFYAWLCRRGLEIDYTGWDLTPSLVEEARGKYAKAKFEVANLLDGNGAPGSFDFVMASGIFTFRRNDPEAYFSAMLRGMYEKCRRGVAVNCLSNRLQVSGGEGEFRMAPGKALECAFGISESVVLRHDYHPGDFTLYLYKDGGGGR